MKRSIRTQLLQWLLLPLFAISLITSAIAYFLSFIVVTEIYDKELLNSADSVITRLEWKNEQVTVKVPPQIMSLMAHDDRDDFYFQISWRGKPIFGNATLPVPNYSKEPVFSTARINGEDMRVLFLPMPEEDLGPDDAMLTVAETGHARAELVHRIVGVVWLPQILLIVGLFIAVWIGVGKGLRRLEIVRESVSQRSTSDLHPVTDDVPVEVLPLVEALNRLFAALGEDIDRQRRFSANAAHQLRTPLAGLGTYCELATRYASAGKVHDLLGQMQTIILRMTSIVNQLLCLARCESVVSICDSLDLNAVAANMTAEMVPSALTKNIELEFEPSAVSSRISGDSQSLHEMAKNLIDNAIKYTPSGGKVVVGVTADDKYASLFVDDTGPGIAVSEHEKIFERFYRVANSNADGTGLGLAIVKDVADAHNAEIIVKTGTSGSGTRMIVRFALSADQSSTELISQVNDEIILDEDGDIENELGDGYEAARVTAPKTTSKIAEDNRLPSG